MTQSPSLVVFDLGRVLMRICDGWQHACVQAGVPVPEAEMSDPAKAALHDAVVRSEVGELDLAGFCECAAPHLGLSAEHVRRISDVYLVGPYPGATELIDALNAAGVQTACLSNTNVNHWRIMNDPSHGCFLPLGRLTHRFASQLIGLRKPDPRIYEHVERTARVEPRRIQFFDDLPENIVVAQQRGWNAQQIGVDADPIAQARQNLRACGIDV
jgi:FMN phosphatase YigB (HAD superfamily)